jgi:hypothetical protein
MPAAAATSCSTAIESWSQSVIKIRMLICGRLLP